MQKLETIRMSGDPNGTTELCPVVETEEREGVEPVSEKERGRLKEFFSRMKKPGPKPFPWKAINPRNGLIAACVALIAVAGYLNIRFSVPALTEPSDEPADAPQTTQNADASEDGDFFAQAVISRERVRDEAIDVLRELTESETADAQARQDAYVQMNRLAEEISSEINIENLVRSKGFEQCVAVVNEKNVNVIVQSAGLTPGEVAQIKEIVYVQTGVLPKDIKIIERSPAASDEQTSVSPQQPIAE